jgi:subtilase family serine protease
MRLFSFAGGLPVALSIIVLIAWHGVATPVATPAPVPAQVVPGTMSPLVRGAVRLGPLPASQPLTLTLTLQPRDPGMLARFAAAVTTPGTPLFRHFITPLQFAQAFAPTLAARQAVAAFLRAAGLRLVQEQDGGLALRVSGTAGQVAAAFHVALNVYRASDGRRFFANDRAITLPAAIAPLIVGVAGLESATRFHPLRTARAQPARHAGTPLRRPHASSGSFTMSQLAQLYNFPSGVNAAHARLALLELDGYLPGDIAAFAATAAPGVNTANVVRPRLVDIGSPLPAGAGAVEDELDIEVALGLAPSIGGIDVYEAPNTAQGWMDLLASMAGDNTDGTISISWGECELDAGAAWMASENVYFQQMVAQGQDVFAAAGDTGAYDCLPNDGSGSGDTRVSVDDPASNPNVVAVGGTSLFASGTSYGSEIAWNSFAGPGTYAATGGGISQQWSAPAWQVSAGVAGGSQPMRAVPDVAVDADPATGYLIYCSVADCLLPGWYAIGGTSAAAPTWAALAALTNVVANKRVGLITPALYALYGTSAMATTFHDITSGTNGFPGFAPGYSAKQGYDMVTGFGSPNGQAVANALAGLGAPGGNPTPTPTATQPTSQDAPAGVYLAAQGSNGADWVSADLAQASSLPFANGNWLMLDSTTFQGAPAIASGGDADGGIFWLAGIGADGSVRVGAWYPLLAQFSGWSVVPGATCKGNLAAAYAQQTLFVICMTLTGGLVINAYNPAAQTWGGWALIGGGLMTPPTVATDGTNLLILAQAPLYRGDQSDWYTLYSIGSGATTIWRRFLTTCEATPDVAYRGSSTSDYALSCIAADTGSMWSNVFVATPQGSGLHGWLNLGTPARGVGFHAATAVASNGSGQLTYIGLGTNNAIYAGSGGSAPWQALSLAGIFTSSASATYFGG